MAVRGGEGPRSPTDGVTAETPAATGSLRPNRREITLVGALFFAMLVSTFPEFTLGVLAPILIDELAIGEASIGIAAATMYLGAAIVARTAGRRLDDIGGRAALIVLYGAALGSLLVLASSRSIIWLIGAGAIGSVALGINNPISSRFIVAAVSPGRRGLAIGVKQTGVKAGQTLAGALIPWLSVTLGWRGGLLAFCAAAVVVLLCSLPVVPTPHLPSEGRPTSVAAARTQVRWLQLFSVSMAIGQSAITAYLALYAVRRLDMSLTQGGLLVATFAITAVVARLVWVTVADRIGHPSRALVLIAGGAVLGLVLFVGAAAIGPAAVWIAAVITGITVGSWNVVVQLAVLAEVEATRTASATGAVQAAFMFGMASGAPLFGGIVEISGSFELAWTLAIVMAALALVIGSVRHRRITGDPT